MAQITPILPEGTITVQAKTQPPSAKLDSLQPPPSSETKESISEVGQSPSERKAPEQDQKLLKARLIQEKIKQQLAAERKKLDAEKRELEMLRANSRKWQEAAELAQQGRYVEAAQKADISYDQLTQQILNGGNIPPARVAETTAEEIVAKRLEEFKKQQQQETEAAQQRQYQEALKSIEAEVKYVVDSSDKYPLAKNSESYQDIVKYIESEFHKTGRIVSVQEALDKWEAEALEGLEELLKQEKIRANVLKESPKPNQEQVVPKTLSQRTMAPIPAPKALSPEERRQRAIDAFYGRILS